MTRVHRLAAATTSLFDISQSGQPVSIGGVVYGTFQNAVNFDLAELVVVHSSSGVVADGDVASVQGYLKQKYNL